MSVDINDKIIEVELSIFLDLIKTLHLPASEMNELQCSFPNVSGLQHLQIFAK